MSRLKHNIINKTFRTQCNETLVTDEV